MFGAGEEERELRQGRGPWKKVGCWIGLIGASKLTKKSSSMHVPELMRRREQVASPRFGLSGTASCATSPSGFSCTSPSRSVRREHSLLPTSAVELMSWHACRALAAIVQGLLIQLCVPSLPPRMTLVQRLDPPAFTPWTTPAGGPAARPTRTRHRKAPSPCHARRSTSATMQRGRAATKEARSASHELAASCRGRLREREGSGSSRRKRLGTRAMGSSSLSRRSEAERRAGTRLSP